MFTEEAIIQKIKAGYRSKIIKYGLCMLIMPSFFVISILSLSRITRSDAVIYTVIFVTIGIVASFVVDYFLIWKKFIAPTLKEGSIDGDPVFRSFKDVKELTAAINDVVKGKNLYQNGDFYFSYKYIVNLKDPTTIMRLEDISNSFVTGDPHDAGGKIVVVEDCHNRTSNFSISGDQEAAMHICKMIYEHCPRLKDVPLKNDSVVTEL